MKYLIDTEDVLIKFNAVSQLCRSYIYIYIGWSWV